MCPAVILVAKTVKKKNDKINVSNAIGKSQSTTTQATDGKISYERSKRIQEVACVGSIVYSPAGAARQVDKTPGWLIPWSVWLRLLLMPTQSAHWTLPTWSVTLSPWPHAPWVQPIAPQHTLHSTSNTLKYKTNPLNEKNYKKKKKPPWGVYTKCINLTTAATMKIII